MARFICPCCGQSFNGKKCRNCYYEVFDKEISRGLHTHQEVNILDTPAARPARKQSSLPVRPAQVQRDWERQKQEFRRNQERKRQKKGLPKWLIWILVFTLLEPVLLFAAELIDDLSRDFSSSFVTSREPEAPEPDAVLPDNARQLFSADGFTLYLGDSEDDLLYPLYLENTTDQDVRLSARQILLDGFVSEQSNAWCDSPAGTLRQGELWLDAEDIGWAVIGTPSQIKMHFAIYDADSYEDILLASADMNLGGSPLPVTPEGDVLMDTDEVLISYIEYTPDDYAPDTFWEGTLRFYIENRTSETLSFYTDSVLVNGEESSLGMWCEVPAGCRTVTHMWLFGLEDLNIEDKAQVDTLELYLMSYGETTSPELGWVTMKP